ncbi:MAG: class I mannose-6-phosphate isomerase [Clostridia bacterium]|nr:class I mannose-6-phosphate isomerase [Clostridia bacterium]
MNETDRILPVSPYLRSAVWGGQRLKALYPTDLERPAEAWIFSLLPDHPSTLPDGTPLPDALRAAGVPEAEIAAFPLVKRIDAERDLSVQVHPDDDYARAHGSPCGKNEWWYVTHAGPEARIAWGITSREALRAAMDRGDPAPALRSLSVRSGQHFLIPAGMVHALGAGVEVLEVQQPSDVTYRLWDYGRLDADGRPRELHVRQALDVARAYEPCEIEALRYARTEGVVPRPTAELSGSVALCLCAAPWFRVVHLSVTGEARLASADELRCLAILDGAGTLAASSGREFPVRAGDTFALLPDGGPLSLSGCLSAALIRR